MELVALHHGGHISAPHRAPLHGGFESRPTPGEASPAMEATTADARGGPAAMLRKLPKPRTARTSRDITSTGPPPDLPLLDLKTNQSDHRTPNGVVLAPWRTLRKDNHLQTRPKVVRHYPADATPLSQGARWEPEGEPSKKRPKVLKTTSPRRLRSTNPTVIRPSDPDQVFT
jgi:hypothetical protein